ncbi:hypothetical protein [Streptomyces sp. NBC_00076]|uniref:hypothetical protein n=1 Tax=Streptomyces sp. NBC_00076 TaxID=2975642 RepID=UPI003252961B
MDLQGIGAVSAATVAAVSIPITALVGRWQMRGAMRAAEETSRAAVTQANSAYRAALDSVRAEASNAHSQWRRGLRRDAYAALLLAAHNVETAGTLLTSGNLAWRVEQNVFATQNAAISEAMTSVRGAALVVQLEGPDTPATYAASLVSACGHYVDVHVQKAEADQAEYVIRTECAARPPDDPLNSFLDITSEISSIVTRYSPDDESLDHDLGNELGPSRLRELQDTALSLLREVPDFRSYGIVLLVNETTHPQVLFDSLMNSHSTLLQARGDFLAAARDAVDKASDGTS